MMTKALEMRKTEASTTCSNGHDWWTYGTLRPSSGALRCNECSRINQDKQRYPMPVRTDAQRAAKLEEFNAAMRRRYPKAWS